jgi:hypothetical protein
MDLFVYKSEGPSCSSHLLLSKLALAPLCMVVTSDGDELIPLSWASLYNLGKLDTIIALI